MALARVKQPTTLAANATKSVLHVFRGDTAFHLRKPIDLVVRRKDGAVTVGYAPLNLEGYGRNEQQALESFADQFAGMWIWIANARDAQLDSDARQLKRRMLALVESATPLR